MPSILDLSQKDAVKLAIPKLFNKIFAVAVARLYVAYPDRTKWAYTGLEGAVVVLHDKAKHTFRIKLVDVSVSRNNCAKRYSKLICLRRTHITA
jgi:hypothetical protein